MPIRMTGLTSGLDTESIVNALMSAQRTKQTKVENKKQKLEWKQEIWKGLNTKIYGFYKDSLSKMKYASNYSTKKAAVSDSTKLTATASTKAAAGSYKVEIKSIASAQYVTSGKLSTYKDSDGKDKTAASSTKLNDLGMTSGTVLKLKVGDKSTALEVNDSTTIDDFVKFCSDAGLNATFDEKQQRFFLSSKDSGSENSFGLSASENTALSALGLKNFDGSADVAETDSDNDVKMVVTKATDTEVVYNGATLTSNNTSIDVAGVTLNLLGTTATGETVNVTVSNDTSAVYDTIKEFITEYNSILKTMNTYYDAASASSYEVLTDEQKEAMSDDEVDKWNTKIKDSLLRRDSTLSGLISTMKTNMMGTVTASNGKTYSLANLGITTSSKNYNEGGLLHIKGDEDDDEFADSTNTLMQMLEEDPDTVKEVLSGLAKNLYDGLNKKMETSTLSSALTFYNDKEMASQLSDYKKEISDWESKLSDMEERYYSQFSAMETALAKIQSQQNTLSSYLGS